MLFQQGQVALLDLEHGDLENLAWGVPIDWSENAPPAGSTPTYNPQGTVGWPQQLITFGINSGGTLLSALASRISGGLVGPSTENLRVAVSPFVQQQYGGVPVYGAAGAQGNVANVGSTAGAALGGVGDAIGQIVFQHPYLTVGFLVGLGLLLMPSPRGRR
jgi:hypothetical protein